MWDEGARAKYARKGRRDASDTTDEEWRLIEPLLPPARRLGRPRTTPLRAVVDALLTSPPPAASGGCFRRTSRPTPRCNATSTAGGTPGCCGRSTHLQVMLVREASGRGASPTAGVVDSQSVKTTEGGPRGYDAGKKIKGRKRHIVTDTAGNLVGAVVHPADVQDRDGAPLVLASIRRLCPWLRHVFADGGYAGDKLRTAMERLGDWTFEIVKRSDAAKGFVLLPRRWVVERTFAWLGRCRRLAKDFEKSVASATAWIFLASVRMLMRRIAREAC